MRSASVGVYIAHLAAPSTCHSGSRHGPVAQGGSSRHRHRGEPPLLCRPPSATDGPRTARPST
eukprot:scaffold2079_cov122-Isochrysis_galbana.AAC.4